MISSLLLGFFCVCVFDVVLQLVRLVLILGEGKVSVPTQTDRTSSNTFRNVSADTPEIESERVYSVKSSALC